MCKPVDLLLSVGEDCVGEWGEEWCGSVDVLDLEKKLGWAERVVESFS